MPRSAGRQLRVAMVLTGATLALLCAGPAPAGDGEPADRPQRSSRAHQQGLLPQEAERPSTVPPYWNTRPDRYIGRHRQHGERGLRYHRHQYRYDTYDYTRRTYPHTYRGQFGDPPADERLELRFYQGPGFSPFSRGGNGYDRSDASEYHPEFYPPAREMPAPASRPKPGLAAVPEPEPERAAPAPRPQRKTRDPQVFEALREEAHAEAPYRKAEQADLERAWRFLGRGKAESAQFAFSTLALQRPNHGLPRAGYALSMATQGDYDQAVWAMRRAFRTDRDWPQTVPEGDDLGRRMLHLAQRFDDADPATIRRADAMFMVAAVQFLLRDFDAADRAVLDAIDAGDRDVSILILRSLIRRGDTPRSPAIPRLKQGPARKRRHIEA